MNEFVTVEALAILKAAERVGGENAVRQNPGGV